MPILTDKDFLEATEKTTETKTLTDADFLESKTLNDEDFLSTQPQDQTNLFIELFKGIGAGTEVSLGQSIGSPLIAIGESLQAEAQKPIRAGGEIHKPLASAFMTKTGKKIEALGTKLRDFFVKNAQKGFEAPTQEIMEAKFGEEGYGQKIAYSLGSSIPMMTAAIGVTAATQNPFLGASIFGPQAFGSFYDEARRNEVEIDKAIGLSLVNAAAQVGLETIPLFGWLRRGGGLFKRILRGALQEGLIEEGSQQLVQNTLEGIGWKGKDVDLFEGMTESIIVGTIMGAGMGIVPSSATIEDIKFDAKKRIITEVLKDAKSQGLTREQVQPVINEIVKQIDKVSEEKVSVLSDNVKEEIVKDSEEDINKALELPPETEETIPDFKNVEEAVEYGRINEDKIQQLENKRQELSKQPTEDLKIKSQVQFLNEAINSAGEQIQVKAQQQQSPEVIRRSQIISDLSQRLNVPVRKGGFGGSERATRQAIGIYKPRPDIIRWKAGGVGTISHEIGHFLDDNFKDLNILVRANRSELGPIDYDATKQRADEGFSEFLRYWITQPEAAQQKAPDFHVKFTAWLENNPEIKNILTTAKEQYQTWLAMPAEDKVKSQISFDPETQGGGYVLDTLYDKTVDEEAPFQRYVDLAKKLGIQVTEENNPYVLVRLFKGWIGKANHWLNHKTFNTKLEITGKGLKEILWPVRNNLDDLSTYLVARRVPELLKRRKTSGIDEKDALTTIIELDKKYPQFKKIAQELYGYQDRLLLYAFENGLVSAEGLIKMKELNQNYVPFYRVFESLQGKGYMGDTFANLASPIKRMSYKGSERDIIDPIESIMKNTYAIINSADRNAVGRAMVVLSKQHKELGRLFEKIATPLTKVASVNIGEALQAEFGKTESLLANIPEEIWETIINVFRPSFFTPQDSVITVMQGGKKEFYYVDPSIYKAILGLEAEEAGTLIKILSYPARWLRAGATSLSPEFLVRNPLRDQMSAYIYSKTGYLPVIDLARGIFNLVGKSDLYWEWVRGGGEHATIVSVDREYMRHSMVELFHANWKDAINPLKWLQAISEAGEQATRLGEFIKGRQKSMGIKKAALSARDVTLDFAKMGSSIKNWNRMTAFLNANIQGLFRPAQAFREYPVATTFKIFTGITLPSIILYLINKDDERYKELPRWQKDFFWIIRIPANTPSGQILIRIPKPFELGIVFGSIPERIMEYIYSKDPQAFNNLTNTLLASLPNPMPTALTPIIENITNYNFFKGRKLESEGLERLLPEERYTQFTSEIAKKLGRIMGVSPLKIENLVSGYTGGGGNLTLDLLDNFTGKKSKLPLTLEDMPLIRGFMAREPIGSVSESVNKFYESYDKITKTYNTIQALKKRKEYDKVDELRKRSPNINSDYNKIIDTADYLSQKRKAINRIIDSDKPDYEKVRIIRELAISMTRKAQATNARLIH